MDTIMNVIKKSINSCIDKKGKRSNNVDHIFLTWCQGMNDKIILAERTGCDSSLGTGYIQDIFCNFMWKVRCCEDTTVVQEAYNTMHVIGMLACKATYHLITTDNNHKNETMVTISVCRDFLLKVAYKSSFITFGSGISFQLRALTVGRPV